MGEEIEEESFEQIDDEFEEEEELDGDDIELVSDEPDDDDADEPTKKRSGGKDDDTVAPGDYEQVVKANPKRQNRALKQALVIEGILDAAELGTEEGAAKAWAKLQDKSAAKPRKYSLKTEFALNDLISHPSFGQGYVVEILSATKVSVLFENGMKRLAHNRN